MADYTHSSKFHEISERIKKTNNTKDLEAIQVKLTNIEQDSEVTELLELCEKRMAELEELITEQKYQEALAELNKEGADLEVVQKFFEDLNGYKDSEEIIIKIEREIDYRISVDSISSDNPDWRKLFDSFKLLDDYKESKKYLKKCSEEVAKLDKAEKEQKEAELQEIYDKAVAVMSEENPNWTELKQMFEQLGDFKDSKDKYSFCFEKASQIEQAKIKKKKRTKRIALLVSLALIVIAAGIVLIYNYTQWEADASSHWHPLFGGYESHSYSLTSSKESTCTEQGENVYTCSVCGHTHIEYLLELPHTADEGTVEKEPTCTATGIKMYRCTVCGGNINAESLPALGHTMDDGTIVEESTCAKEGKKEYYCTVCGKLIKTESLLKKSHTLGDPTVLTEPTCTARGAATYTCQKCGYTETKILAALGHDWKETYREDSTCSSKGIIGYQCSRCGEKKTQTIWEKAHSYSLTLTVDPTCTNDGYELYTCDNCGKETTSKLVAHGHTLVDDYCIVCGIDYKQYSVGSKGPAGGYVFYDCDADNKTGNKDGLKSSVCGWRFLEAAPSDMSTGYVWGNDGSIGTKTGIGTGKANTSKISTTRNGETTAAKACLDYSINGFDDWFLPSRDELNLMYNKKNVIGGFSYYFFYWSSSEISTDDAWCQRLYDGSYGDYTRDNSCYVRAIRAF